ncbi:MAG: hypothetical protein ACM3QZ_09145 [Solirubrobacterales bacterium]
MFKNGMEMFNMEKAVENNMKMITAATENFWALTRNNLETIAQMNQKRGEMIQNMMGNRDAMQQEMNKVYEHLVDQSRVNYARVEESMKDMMNASAETFNKFGLKDVLKSNPFLKSN